ncbi:MAG: hypothetical protein GQ528_07340, partial [Woeseiaceae bacterium]|nr:hypothetical protein [Woeseiaceae bacterium]
IAMKDGLGAEALSVVVDTLEQMEGSEVDELILGAVRSSNESQMRVQLIRLLAKRNVTGATEELLKQAAGSDPSVSIAAFQALKSLAGFDELPSLIALTKECRNDSVRDAAVNAVCGACKNNGRVDRSGALVLKELKTSTTTVEKESWIRVLTLLGHAEALPAITATLQSADRKLVQSTISSLSRWPDPTPIESLFDVVEGDFGSSLRRHALTAVLQLAATAADRRTATDDQLIAWFQRANKAVQSVREKQLLISGLGRVKHIESVRLAESYLDDPNVKTEAAYAIVNAAGPLAKGPDYKAVQTVLKKISGVKDQHLLSQIENLHRDIKSTAAKVNKY